MKFPKLVRNPKQEVSVIVNDKELSEDGELAESEPLTLKCYLQFGTLERLTADKRVITLQGIAYFDGDIFPEQTISSGTLVYGKDAYTIHKGQKHYNPDGTVNYTTLELI